ncbi:MAG: FtsX-like permease family protein [Candidatus Heimdallarchaeota archaeon]|nr:MAG: FtsX-like permease family protein [Candidatus Heimdallarchaeota archaeon]
MGRGHSIRGKIRLLLLVLRINLKKSFITLLGMTIALAIIAASLIFLESNEINYYLEVLEDPDLGKPFEFRIYEDTRGNYSIKDITMAHGLVNEKFAEYNLRDFFIQSKYPFLFRKNRKTLFRNTTETYYYFGLPMNESIIKDCVNGSDIPRAQNEILVFIPNHIPIELNINETVNLSLSYKYKNNEQFHNLSLKISGILTETSIRSSSQLWDMVNLYHRSQFIMNVDQYLLVLNTLKTLSDESISNSFYLYYQLDDSTVNTQNARQIIYGLVEFGGKDWDFSAQINSKMFDIYYGSAWKWFNTISMRIGEFRYLFFFFTIFCLPAFIITFLLVNFSLGIINEGRRKTLALYKMRGISKVFLFTVLCVETMTLALIASVLGVILSIPVYFLISATTGYLSFDLTKWPDVTIISRTTIISVIGFSLCFTFLLHLRTIIKLTNAGIVFLVEEASKKKKRKRGAIQQNIDVFLLLQGILGIFFLNLFMRILIEAGQLESGLIIFMLLISILVFLSPLSLLVGFILAFNRLMPVILDKLGGILWKRDYKLFVMATRNLFVNIKFTTRTTLLIAISISFLMVMSSLPVSMNQYNIDSTYYKAGSDLVIRAGDFLGERALRNLSTGLNNLPGFTTTIVSFTDYRTSNKEFIGIEDNFHEVAFWKTHYAKKPLSSLVSVLYNSKAQVPVIIDSFSAKLEELNVNETYPLKIGSDDPLNLTIVEKTDYWPVLIRRVQNKERFFIMKRSTYSELISDGDSYIWCKIDPITNEAIEQAKNMTQEVGVDINDFYFTAERVKLDPDSLKSIFPWIITNFNFLVMLIGLLLLLVLFTMTRVTNQLKEIGLSRALGMKFRQVFILMFLESFLLILISGLPGGLIGLGLLMILINYGQGPPFSYGPPFILMIDIPSLLFIFGSIIIITIFLGFIASYRVTRADVSKILKVE